MNSVPESTDDAKSTSKVEGGCVVECSGLTKRYGDFTALSDCSLTVDQGDVFGLLGPNGAGKTTFIRTLLGYLKPSSGKCAVLGIDPQVDSVQVRRQVSYLPGEARLPGNMRGAQVIRYFAQLHPEGDLDRSQSIAEQLELDAHRRVAFMSTGMRQKLALAVVFGVHTPLLILDEPTANLDPSVRGKVLELVRDAKQEGRTIIFSSHVLSEIEDTCNRVVFLKSGELAHELRLAELFQRHRVTANPLNLPIEVPDALADRVSIVPGFDSSRLCMETSGDLASMLSWIDSLSLKQMRIEPLGLRTVYDSVHTGQLAREDKS